jgi:hypothetical protein
VGGYLDSSVVGATWVFTRSSGVWSQQGNKLVGTGRVGFGYQGTSVSLSSDGNTAIVGGYADNSDVGAAWVFARSGGVWTQRGNKLVGTGAVGNAKQGSVSLSSDGNTALVGGEYDNSAKGAAWVFTRTGTSVQEQAATVPSQWLLEPNYPNPFNPSTTIRYGVPERSPVSLAIFNTLGQRVTELVNGEVEAGYHEVKFDAAGLPSGVYLYRLQAGGYVEAKKLLMVR